MPKVTELISDGPRMHNKNTQMYICVYMYVSEEGRGGISSAEKKNHQNVMFCVLFLGSKLVVGCYFLIPIFQYFQIFFVEPISFL